MKKTILSVMALALLVCLAIFSCQKEGQTTEKNAALPDDSGKAAMQSKNSTLKLAWLPEGTKIRQLKDALEVTAPKDWHYVGFDKDGKFFELAAGKSKSISCTCNTSGTCKPFTANGPWGGTQGCTGTCTNCTMKQSAVLQSHESEILGGGYISVIAGAHVMKSGEWAPSVFDALFEYAPFKDELASFIRIAYNGKPVQNVITGDDGVHTAPLGHALVAVSIMGRAMMLVLPDEYVKSVLGYVAVSKSSCSCNGAGGCKLKYKGVPGLNSTWCEGTCNSCTLTISGSHAQSHEYYVEIRSYAY